MTSDLLAFHFYYGSVALNFVGTLGRRASSRIERLRSCDDLTTWLHESALYTGRVPVHDADLYAARELREALARLFEAKLDRAAFGRSDLRAANNAARAPLPHIQLAQDGSLARSGNTESALAEIARDALVLLSDPRIEALRRCEMDDCGGIYLDESRGRRRRWCSMERCGNRAKATAFRRRHAHQP